MANLSDPIDAAFGRYLGAFHKMLVTDTPALQEFAERDFAKCAVLVPGRMIDQAEEMLASWRKNDTSQQSRATPFLPIMLVASAKDYTPAQPDYTRQGADPAWVTIPGDPKERILKLRTAVSEVRFQVVIAAADKPTARSIALQLQMYASAMENRRFFSTYKLASVNTPWPVSLEMPEVSGISLPTDVKNLTLLAVDFNARAATPLLMYPKHGAPDADGQGDGTYDNPDGYLGVLEVDITAWPDVDPETPPPGLVPEHWTVLAEDL